MANRIHPATDETLQRIATAVERIAGANDLQWDEDAGRYTNDSVQRWLASMRDGKAYGVSIPKGSATACAKLGANAGIAAPTPGTSDTPAIDPYAGVGPFVHFDVNGYVDADGTPHVTAIEGDGRFARDGSNGNVWVLAPVLWQNMDETGADAVTLYISDTRLAGMGAQPQAYLPDGTLRPFMLYAKYVGSNDGAGMMASVSGRKPWTYNVSHDSLITQCANASTGYSGKSIADDWYVKAMFLVKYATKNSQSVFAGCTSYDVTAQVTVAESGTSRVIVSTANADKLVVGSAVMVGTANTDRNDATANDIVDSARIIGIEAYDSSNSAVTLDVAATFTTATTHYLKSAPWWTGACDDVEGDGSPTSCTSGKEPFKIQGIETAMGFYELLGDVIVSNTGSGWELCICYDSKKEAASVTSDYAHTGKYLPADGADSWKYPMYPSDAGGLLHGTGAGASQTTGMSDGTYTHKLATTGTREWLGLGGLRSGGIAGLWYVHAGSGLTSAWWDIGSRLSATGRALAA